MATHVGFNVTHVVRYYIPSRATNSIRAIIQIQIAIEMDKVCYIVLCCDYWLLATFVGTSSTMRALCAARTRVSIDAKCLPSVFYYCAVIGFGHRLRIVYLFLVYMFFVCILWVARGSLTHHQHRRRRV